jgi:hypothetical protein
MKPSLKLAWGTASLFIVPSMNCRPNRQLPPKGSALARKPPTRLPKRAAKTLRWLALIAALARVSRSIVRVEWRGCRDALRLNSDRSEHQRRRDGVEGGRRDGDADHAALGTGAFVWRADNIELRWACNSTMALQ